MSRLFLIRRVNQDVLLKFDLNSIRCRFLRVIRLMLCLVLLIYTFNYVRDALGRANAGEPPYRWWVSVASVQGVSYTAKSAFVRGDTIVLRLYRTGDPELLAERMYTDHGVEIFWGRNELIYDTSDESFLGGGIELPPTWLDRFLARLL